MPGAKFKVEVTAENKTASGLKQVKASFEELNKPVERIGRLTDRWTKGSRIGQLGDLFSGATRQASKFADAGAEASAGMLGLEGSAAVATLGVGALAVGLGVAAEKSVAFVNRWSEGAAGLGRTASMLGMATRQLQLFQRAGEYAGVDAQATTSALENLNNVVNDARYGRNDQARQAMNQLGIKLKLTATGAVDTRAMLMQLADALHNETNPATRALEANIFGVLALLPELSKGSKALSDDLKTALQSGRMVSDDQSEAAQRYQRNLKQLRQEMGGLKNTIGNDVLPAFNALLEVTNRVARAAPRVADKPLVRAYGADLAGTVPVIGPLLQAWMRRPHLRQVGNQSLIEAAAESGDVGGPGDRVRGFFRGRGWTAEQARGIAAGIWAESKFDPGAIDPLSGAFGLDQALGPRRARLFQRYGAQPNFDQQLDFIDWELKGGDRGGAAVQSAGSADEAMRAYLTAFMRPGNGLASDLQRGADYLSGKVRVEINLNGAPSGTTAIATSTSPQIAPSLNIGTSLPTW